MRTVPGSWFSASAANVMKALKLCSPPVMASVQAFTEVSRPMQANPDPFFAPMCLAAADKCSERLRGSLSPVADASRLQALLCTLAACSPSGLQPEPMWGWGSDPCLDLGVELRECLSRAFCLPGSTMELAPEAWTCRFPMSPARNLRTTEYASSHRPSEYGAQRGLCYTMS